MKHLGQLYSLLEKEDEITVLELLDITSPELVDSFKHKVRKRYDYVCKFYEESSEEEEVAIRDEERNEPRGLGSKSVWEEAGFDIEDDNY